MKNFVLFNINFPLCWILSYAPQRLTCPDIELEISFKVFEPTFSINDISKSLKFKSKSRFGFSLIAITVPSDSRVIFSLFNNFKSTEYESKSVFPKALSSKLPNSYSLILISFIENQPPTNQSNVWIRDFLNWSSPINFPIFVFFYLL